MTRFPSGWFILPAILLSAAIWVALASIAFASTGGEVIDPEFTFADFLAIHAKNVGLIILAAAVFGAVISIASE